MATPPFSTELVTKLSGATAWRFNSSLGPVFTPRFFCCTSPNDLGLADGKEPVAVISLTPHPAHTNEIIAYSGAASYDPDGSIVGYDWSFEGHTPASGTAVSGNLTYNTAGTYTIELVVEDGTGLFSSPARVELVVDQAEFNGWIASSSGIYYSAGGTTPPAYTLQLASNAYRVMVDPSTYGLADANKILWGATEGSIVWSDDGGSTWADVSPGTVTNAWSDTPAPTPPDLTYKDLALSGGVIYAASEWQNGSNEWRSWVFYGDITLGDAIMWSEL